MTDFKKISAVLLAMLFLTVAATLFVLAEPDDDPPDTSSSVEVQSESALSEASETPSESESGTEASSETESGDPSNSDDPASSEEGDPSEPGESSDTTDSSEENESSDTENEESSDYEPASENLTPSWNEYESERSTGGGSRIVIPPDPSYSGRVSSDWTTNDRSNIGQSDAGDTSAKISTASATKNLFDLKSKFKRWIVLPATVALLSGAALLAVNLNYSKSGGRRGSGKERHDPSGPRRPRD